MNTRQQSEEDKAASEGRTAAWLDYKLGGITGNPYHTNTQEYHAWQKAYRGVSTRVLILLVIGCVLFVAGLAACVLRFRD